MKRALPLDVFQIIIDHSDLKTTISIASASRSFWIRFGDYWRIRQWKDLDVDGRLINAAMIGDRQLVDIFISHGATAWDDALFAAIECGRRDLVHLFIDKGETQWDRALMIAAEHNKRDLVDLFIAKGGSLRFGFHGAGKGGHCDLAEYLISRGATLYFHAFILAAEAGHGDFLERFNPNDKYAWNEALRHATKGGHCTVVNLCISKGADAFSSMLWIAAANGHRKLADLAISKGATDLESARCWAEKCQRTEMVVFLDEKIKSRAKNARH